MMRLLDRALAVVSWAAAALVVVLLFAGLAIFAIIRQRRDKQPLANATLLNSLRRAKAKRRKQRKERNDARRRGKNTK